MKKVIELDIGDIIEFPFGAEDNYIKVVIDEIEKYNLWTRIKFHGYGEKRRGNTWVYTDALVIFHGKEK